MTQPNTHRPENKFCQMTHHNQFCVVNDSSCPSCTCSESEEKQKGGGGGNGIFPPRCSNCGSHEHQSCLITRPKQTEGIYRDIQENKRLSNNGLIYHPDDITYSPAEAEFVKRFWVSRLGGNHVGAEKDAIWFIRENWQEKQKPEDLILTALLRGENPIHTNPEIFTSPHPERVAEGDGECGHVNCSDPVACFKRSLSPTTAKEATQQEWEEELVYEVLDEYLYEAKMEGAGDEKVHLELMRGHFEKLKAFIRTKLAQAKAQGIQEEAVNCHKHVEEALRTYKEELREEIEKMMAEADAHNYDDAKKYPECTWSSCLSEVLKIIQ